MAIETATDTAKSTLVKSANLEEDVQKIREAVQKKVKEKLSEITTPATPVSNKKGIIGSIIQIDPNQIIINNKGQTRNILVSENTVFVDANRNKTKVEKIKVGQGILAMGLIDKNNILEASRVVVMDLKILENKYQTVIGKVVDISKESPIFVLIPSDNKDNQYQIKTDSLTETIYRNGSKMDFKNLASGQKIVVVLKPDDKIKKTFYAAKIINLENKAIVSPTSIVTPTPKP